MIELPRRYHVLPHSIPFTVPGFEEQIGPNVRTFTPKPIDCEQWFEQFACRIEATIGREFLPVCRMSDGELTFLLGHQPPSHRLPFVKRSMLFAKWLGIGLKGFLGNGFRADTAYGVSSGQYSKAEWRGMRGRYEQDIAKLSQKGILALHLSYTDRPFQESFFPPLKTFFRKAGISLSFQNYCPFYFVYALLVGPRRKAIFEGKHVLIVHSADGDKRQRISESLRREGVASIHWIPISRNKSLFDKLSLDDIPSPDLALVGAGVGKPNILLQLAPLGVPCIDAGYIFEVWDNPQNVLKRPMTGSDETLNRLGGEK